MQVACGSGHTAAITAEGGLLTWGYGACGQLGHGDERRHHHSTAALATAADDTSSTAAAGNQSRLTPFHVRAFERDTETSHVSAVACGNAHTLIQVQAGGVASREPQQQQGAAAAAVCACGDNDYGQLGLGDRYSRSVPSEVLDIPMR